MSQRFVDYKTITFKKPQRLGRGRGLHLQSSKLSPLQMISSSPINPRLGEQGEGVPTRQMWKWRLGEREALAQIGGL